MDTCKVITVSATPVAEETTIVQDLNETVKDINKTLDSFEDETDKEKKAKSFLGDFRDYMKTKAFRDDVNATAKKYGVPPKKVAQNFVEKALGIVGDILGVAISTVCNAGHIIVNVASNIAHSVVNLIHSILSGIASIVTLNKTCCSPV
jgi:acid phosphatase class B